MVTIEDFAKLDIRVVKVLDAKPMEDSEKLLKLTVNIGTDPETSKENSTRQILAGIAKHYNPEDLIGKEIVAIVNLEYRKMMGEESQGMILAAGDNEEIALLMPQKEITPGAKIR